MSTQVLKHAAEWLGKEFGSLVGCKITGIVPLTEKNCESMAWEHHYGEAFAFVLDDGRALIISADPEGNGPGWVFII